eukprot:scaffold62364_cov54-Phaeocystis_antarctica.AAC.6
MLKGQVAAQGMEQARAGETLPLTLTLTLSTLLALLTLTLTLILTLTLTLTLTPALTLTLTIHQASWQVPVFCCDELQTPQSMPMFLSRKASGSSGRRRSSGSSSSSAVHAHVPLAQGT